jgi:UDP-3-O-[3-hydroxymyristoyl] glucosamine N-acyltransferase
MEFSAGQVAELIQGKLEGSETTVVTNLSKIDQGEPNTLSFLYSADYVSHLYTTAASVVIISNSIQLEYPVPNHVSLIWVDDARMAFAQILQTYKQYKQQAKVGIHPKATIHHTAHVGENVFIGANVVIGPNVKVGNNCFIHANTTISDDTCIGNDCTIYNNVSIYEECIIGNDCVIQAGAIIGGDGFGFQPNSENNYTKIVHIGNVILEDHVEIGANTTIDRATMGSTIIRKGVKLDNLIQVGHNVEIGENTVIAAQSGIAGSTIIGKNCMIGGQVGFAGHQRIADGVKIAAKTGVPKDVLTENTILQGIPAMPIGDFRKSFVLYKNFPSIKQELDNLKQQIAELKSNN